MKIPRWGVLGWTALSLAGCLTAPAPIKAPRTLPSPAAPSPSPAEGRVQDIIPRIEPRSLYGNPPFYDVFGKRYYVLASSADYVERGVASWYGPGFHKVRTSTGEPYDMYGMSAAHKTLPLPAYVRVTNLQNGRSVIVRVNDRGPFVGNRIIDLSYTAAARLDMLREGTALVEVRALDPAAPAPVQPALAAQPKLSPLPPPPAQPGVPTPPDRTDGPPVLLGGEAAAALSDTLPVPAAAAAAPPLPSEEPGALAATGSNPALFIQAGAFADFSNADRLVAKLRSGTYGSIFVREDVVAGRKLYRVRIGPVPDVAEFDRIVAALEKTGVHDARLASD